jgi:hypothetical protein
MAIARFRWAPGRYLINSKKNGQANDSVLRNKESAA